MGFGRWIIFDAKKKVNREYIAARKNVAETFLPATDWLMTPCSRNASCGLVE